MSTTTTHIKTDKQLVPTLRFKEFDKRWNSFALKDITPLNEKYGIVDGPFGSNLKTIHYKEEGVPIITSGYVTNGYFYAEKYLFVTPEKFIKEKRSAVRAGDIVMAKIGARCGASAILPKKHETSILSGNALKITVDESRFSTMIIWQQLYHLYKTHKIDLLKTVGAQPAISIANLKKFKVVVPTLPEQQKIASFLSAVDEKIQQLTKKKALLEYYKKGVMQQLFPSTGSGQRSGQLRFKPARPAGGDENLSADRHDGNPYPDWEEKRLGEVCECMDNLRRPLNNSERQSMQGVIPYWGANKVMDYVNDYLFDETIVLLAEDGGNFNEYKTRPIANISYGKCWVNNHTHVLKGKNQLSNEFLFYSLVHKNITGFVSGGTRAKLNKSEMLKIPIGYPTIEEQQKIATYLTRIDTKIESVTHQITQTQTFKKGLLQQMFV
jgi:type I restriction enzyme S subunit